MDRNGSDIRSRIKMGRRRIGLGSPAGSHHRGNRPAALYRGAIMEVHEHLPEFPRSVFLDELVLVDSMA
jgi:hypothetical protein